MALKYFTVLLHVNLFDILKMASRSSITATIEILPNQLLEIIFKDLSQEDIGNCSKTCVRWNEIITSVFKDQGNLNLSDLF